MTLPMGFLFSQSNLQDYVDCQRRFQLRHLLHLVWPAMEAEPFVDYERMIDRGSQFHKIIRQHLIGVPESQIEMSIGNDEIMTLWWNSYKHSITDGILEIIYQDGNKRFEELTLSTSLGEFRLIAKYDLLVLCPDGRWIIFDWKTSLKRPKRKWLADRMQTRVYPFVLMQAAPEFTGGNLINPQQIEMIYWFTNQPDQPEHFKYADSAYTEDAKYFENLISTLSYKSDLIFPLTPDTKRCLFCTYRSLCDRGVKPGQLQDLEELQASEASSENVTIDYEQIGEIEF